jgi:leucyl/phenylalanyl-tRNA---protein transferase
LTVPVEPGPSRFAFTLENAEPGDDLVGVGADLAPGTLLAAYRLGLFPMGLGRHGRRPIGWWSPDPRGILPLDRLRISRSLRRTRRRFEIRVDTAFDAVVSACGDRRRPGRWITREIRDAYRVLHEMGWAHSVECWCGQELVGGLYGVGIGGFFAGESMFHTRTDASKAAMAATVDLLREDADGEADRLFDVQWATAHLVSLGVVEIGREEYLERLQRVLHCPAPSWKVSIASRSDRCRHWGD